MKMNLFDITFMIKAFKKAGLAVFFVLIFINTGFALNDPNYYNSKESTTREDGSVWVKNDKALSSGGRYDTQDVNYLLSALKSGASASEIAEKMKKYPNTLGRTVTTSVARTADNMAYTDPFGGVNTDHLRTPVAENVVDELSNMLKKKEITQEEFDKYSKIMDDAADAWKKQSAQQSYNYQAMPPTHNSMGEEIPEDIRDQQRRAQEESDYRERTQAAAEAMRGNRCLIANFELVYKTTCYSCIVVNKLITAFLNGSSKLYEITREAGNAVLIVCFLIWLPIFVLKKISGLTNLEPTKDMIDELLTVFFKVLVAFVVINAGISFFATYALNPILSAGADYGLTVISNSTRTFNMETAEVAISTAQYKGGNLVSPEVLNKLLGLNKAIDSEAATNLVIGNALMCHASNAGAHNFKFFTIPDLWILLAGLAIWIMGFLTTLAVSYYLLDISFKLGIAIISFPIVVALWPFSKTKDHLKNVINMVINAAAVYAFLAIAVTYAITLTGQALRGIENLRDNINSGNTFWISETFAITGPYFLIIAFSFIYAFKLIMTTVTEYSSKFFGATLSSKSPMHHKMTQMTMGAMKKGVTAAGEVVGAAGAVGRATKKVSKKMAGGVSKYVGMKGKSDGDDKDDKGGGGAKPGDSVKNTGKATKEAGKATKEAGKGVKNAGQQTSKGGGNMAKKGAALSKTGVGAIAGVPMMIAGGAMFAAGKTTQAAGALVEKAGELMEKAGKAMEKAGKLMNKLSKPVGTMAGSLKKTGNKWKKSGEKLADSSSKDKKGENKDDKKGGEDEKNPPTPSEDGPQ